MKASYWVYIATNPRNTVLYTGVTNDLQRRMYEHKCKLTHGFTSKYNVSKLVWCEGFDSPTEAIAAEKKIKGWKREKKIHLIEDVNPTFSDLTADEADPSPSAQDDRHTDQDDRHTDQDDE